MEASLASLAGVDRSVVDLESGKAYVWFNTEVAGPTSQELMEAIAKSGFTATKVEFAGSGEVGSPDRSIASGQESSDGGDVAVAPDGGVEAIENPLDFNLKDLTGEEYDGTLLKGHVVLLDFWATWCAPCIKAFPTLNRLQSDFGEKGLRVIGIALNSGTPEDIAEVIGGRTIEYPILLGEAGIEKKFDVLGYPTYVLIGPKGEVQAIYVGEVEDLYDRVSRALLELNDKEKHKS